MRSAEDHVSGERVAALAPEARVALAIGFLMPVALTPARWPLALVIDLIAVLAVVVWFRVPLRRMMKRLGVLAPVLVVAVLIPVIGTGERTTVMGVSLSADGLWSAWGVVAKAFIGVAVSVALGMRTPTTHLLIGLQRLRFPSLMVSIAALMLRYGELLSADITRIRTAMTARGHDARWFWQTRPLATAAGATFVRSFERGERVHAAMLARGFTGSIPDLGLRRAGRQDWLVAMAGPAIGLFAFTIGFYLASVVQ